MNGTDSLPLLTTYAEFIEHFNIWADAKDAQRAAEPLQLLRLRLGTHPSRPIEMFDRRTGEAVLD